MRSMSRRVSCWAAVLCLPLALSARSAGPPTKHTGAPVDGGADCTQCHRTFAPANSGPGRVTISTVSYTPGVSQPITITIDDPTGQRWGFQLTARLQSDQTREAGTFAVDSSIRVRCDDTRDAPCNPDDLQFASHNSTSTKPGTPGPGVFTVQWTPPDHDVGEIVMYAAGNAANNNNAPTGDHIYTTSLVVRPVCTLTEKPTLLGASDAAGFRAAISPNSLIALFGALFAPPGDTFRVARSDLADGKLPSELACVAVEIGGQRAPVFYVQHDQINAQAPTLGGGPVEARVILNPGTPNEVSSDPVTLQVAGHSPGLFTLDGKSVAAIDVSQNNAVIGAPAPARAGDVIAVYGTGFGLSDPPLAAGEIPTAAARMRDAISISIGGVPVAAEDVLYSGVAPGLPGLCQINIRLPAFMVPGDIPITAQVGGRATQAGVILPIR